MSATSSPEQISTIRPVEGRHRRPSDRSVDPEVAPAPGARTRITGLDLARGLAVLGMFGAHVGLPEQLSWSPSSWTALVQGRSAALFAVLAGVSIALLSRGGRPARADDLVRARLRILVRAAWVFAIGGALELLGTGFNVILGVYAVLFVLALPFLRWSPRRLLLLAGALALAAPPVTLLLSQVAEAGGEDSAFALLMINGGYPALLWWPFVLVGLAIGRLDLTDGRMRAVLLAAGTTTAVAGSALGWLSTRLLPQGIPSSGLSGAEGSRVGSWNWAWLSGAEPHSGTTLWLVSASGVAIAVIAACLMASDALPRLTYPLASVGAMALTAYSMQFVVFRVFDPEGAAISPEMLWVLFSAGAIVLSVAWRRSVGRGPLERLLTWSSNLAARPADRAEPAV